MANNDMPKRHPMSNVPKHPMRHTERLSDHHSDTIGKRIHLNPAHKNLLHEKLHIPAGKPILEAKLEKAEHSKSAAERKEAAFAENAKHFNHSKK